jgi:multiple sugar transport system permease protein
MKKRKNIVAAIAAVVLSLVFLSPIFWVFATSIKSPVEALDKRVILPAHPQWGNYAKAWNFSDYRATYVNTIVESIGSTLLTILLAIPAAYALARFHIRGGRIVQASTFLMALLPEVVFIVPLYVLYRITGLYDTRVGIVLVFQIVNLPYAIWMLESFVRTIPVAIEESAIVDGASGFTLLTRIIVPMLAPGISAVAVISIINVWVELLYPLSLSYGANSATIAISIANFKGYGSFNWPVMGSGVILATIPQLLFFIFAQRYLIEGLTAGAVKE